MAAEHALLEVRDLSKQFGSRPVLTRLSLTIAEGEAFGLLGLNGAGKTTLLRCLLQLAHPTAGTIRFNHQPLTDGEIRRQFGYLPEDVQPPHTLSALELLAGLSRTLESSLQPGVVLEQVGLSKHRTRTIGTYSRGMTQRLGLAIALLKDPQVLVLDEPLLGLDLAGQRQVIGLLMSLSGRGKTIIFSSHLFAHLETCAHRVGILHQGRLQAVGTPEQLCRKHTVASLEEAFCKEVGLDDTIRPADVA